MRSWQLIILIATVCHLVPLRANATEPQAAGSSTLEFSDGDSVYIQEPGGRVVRYKAIVVLANTKPFTGLHGLSFTRRMTWKTTEPKGWIDDIRWDVATLTKHVGGLTRCNYMGRIKGAAIEQVIDVLPVFTQLGIDKDTIKKPVEEIVDQLKALGDSTLPNLIYKARIEKEIKLNRHHTEATGIELYLQRAFMDEELNCVKADNWADLKFETPFYVDQRAVINKTLDELAEKLKLANKELESVNTSLAGKTKELEGAEEKLKSTNTSLAKANNKLSLTLTEVEPAIKPKGQSATGFDEFIQWFLLLAVIIFPVLIIGVLNRQRAKSATDLATAVEKIHDDIAHFGEPLSITERVDQVPAQHMPQEVALMLGFIEQFHADIDVRLQGLNQSAKNIVHVISNILDELHLAVTAVQDKQNVHEQSHENVASDMEKVGWAPDENMIVAIETLSSLISTDMPNQSQYGQLQVKTTMICQLVVGIDHSIANIDLCIADCFKIYKQQVSEQETANNLLTQQNEKLSEDRQKLLIVLRRKMKTLAAEQEKLKPHNDGLNTKHENLTHILAGLGYDNGDDQVAASALLLQDLTQHPEHLAYGLHLMNLQQYLAESKALDSALYKGCGLTELHNTLAEGSNFNFFKTGIPQDRLAARWQGQLNFVYRANLLLKTYCSGQHAALCSLLDNCINAIDHLLLTRGFIPHQLSLLNQAQLIEDTVEYAPESPVATDLQALSAFAEIVQPLADEAVVYCDVMQWGYDLIDEEGNKTVGQKSKLVAKSPDSKW